MAFVRLRIMALGCFAAAAAQTGETNVATLRKFFKDAEILRGKAFSKVIMDQVIAQLGSLVASKIDCKATAESPIGFDLHGVSFAECGNAALQMNLGTKMLNWSTDFAVVADTGGQAVLAWQPTEMELQSGEKLRQDTAWKFTFNEDGKISKWTQELDTTALIANAGTRNIATVLKVFDSAKLLLTGRALSPDLISKLAGELASSYASVIDCSMSPASSFGFDLKGVPLQACFAQVQNFLGAAMVDWTNDAIASVPSSAGRTVLLWQTNALDVAGLPLTMNNAFKVDFNPAGLIIGFAQELDTSAVHETRAKAASLASGMSFAAELGALALPGFFVGCGVGSISFVILAARSRPLRSGEGYQRLIV